MSYADLKPVKFEEPHCDATYHQYHSQINDNGLYSFSVEQQEQFSPYPILTLEATKSQYQFSHGEHQQSEHGHNQFPVHYILRQESSECSTPHTPHTPQSPIDTSNTLFRTPVGKMLTTERERGEESSEVTEECRNHWMPMTWIERSSDDPQVFNFVCLWGHCVAVSSSKDEFVDHLNNHFSQLENDLKQEAYGSGEEEAVKCQVRGCGKVLETSQEIQRHLAMHIFQAGCQQKGSEALIEKEEYSEIESCGFEPVTNINYEGDMLVCMWENCQQPFSSLTDLFDHVGHHIDEMSDMDRVDYPKGDRKNVFPCKWTGCTTLSDSKSNLRRHARHHSGEKVLACPFCARFYSRRDKLYDHCVRRTILMNDMEDPFLCKLCQKRFGTEKALCMHVTRHLVSHTCPLCSLAVATRSEIHRHLITKHSRRTKDFKCETCKKMFFSETELNRHAVSHSDIMYSCKHCNEKFKWKKQLLKHLKEHDENFNPSPYTCHLCDRMYTTGFALGRHLTRQHNLQVPYGFSRFTYKKCADGLMRLQTKKLFRNSSMDDHSIPTHSPY